MRTKILYEIETTSLMEALRTALEIQSSAKITPEVIEGGSRTRMHLYLEKTDRGWSLELAGSRSYCTVESVRFYLGLVHHGIFPTFYGYKIMEGERNFIKLII